MRAYPTAAGLALLAHEEIGRHRILLDCWRAATKGTLVTREGVSRTLGDHVEKERRGQLSLTYRERNDSQVGKLLQTRATFPPKSVEYQEADARMRLLDEHRRKRQPGDRHEKRMNAFYVDMLETGWSRPSQLDQEDYAGVVEDALNDYTRARLRVEEAESVHRDHELAAAVAALPSRPTLPSTPWLSLETR